jgi:hypothetical protein
LAGGGKGGIRGLAFGVLEFQSFRVSEFQGFRVSWFQIVTRDTDK